MSGINSSLARKYAMALSGLFLVVFLLQHFIINLTSVFSEEVFNEISHFMGNNPLVQFVLQPVLIFGVLFHFMMGFILDIKNRKARSQGYAQNNGAANSSWMSRNMILSGITILSFLVLHFIDFWFPEMNYKYVQILPEDPNRYFEEMVHKFENVIRVITYVISFFFLMLHLLHGFSSSFQSVGLNNKYTRGIKGFTLAFSIVVPAGFIFIAIFHHLNA
ncbi:succinate dehydrogenase cytochrome b subunit [Flavobacteriaceae bacterium]|uniref:succinate dehydrogenase cytochrome b subunit n=1 Tax=Candidatus Arcticimaribacter forsetii TaxID=2820661 RepID=UPI0020770ABC|nr:succinate dehydrogenase cytochrome b subunit [Candidatus Arcticimaribacter forsetii]MDA8698592.1 succinate dehydrogenase cytochrome b subunit [Flavobacteriaceae bacterium]MDB2326111.1 succinate dehydrogenase cytochrome b subunit [Flavobacteriaceae bacterium]MDB2329057.1 succinate dehydrogenase cytochrome b subunit [Flavobacteriaceae bacterium]MDB2345382.1 succinate dehydrogenase cytochrome b subunit [Flavobacteriaceae bacterium]MDB4674396.1 succinate dehydrogenase cytochrome b subunit [Flav